ncbi:MAG: FAD-dependent oxidoreductase [Pseudonocardiaceae bacterium]
MATITIGKGDERYEALSQGFNQRWVAHPDCIALVATTEDVVDVVSDAIRDGKRISVRSGGHCYENFVCNDDVKVIIDVSQLDNVYYDERLKAHCVGAGATNWRVYTHLYRPFGVVVPGGSCYSVGTGGHICGGGFGLLSRQFGLTVDYLYAVEVVVPRDGKGGRRAEAVIARSDSADRELQDLWWAHTGGGGGNFGVITRYWFRDLPKPPKNVWLSGASFSWSALGEAGFRQLVENYGKFFAEHKDPDDDYANLFAILKLTHVSNGQLGLVAQLDATSPDSEMKLYSFYQAITANVRAEVRNFDLRVGEHAPAQPLTVTGRVMPWIQATQTLDGSGENRRGKYKSAYQRTAFTADQITAFWKNLSDSTYSNPEALLQIDSYGCKINARKPGETAIAQRDSVTKLQYQTYWDEAKDDDKNLAWIRKFYFDVYRGTGGVPVPDQTTDGCYINYPDVDLGTVGQETTEWNKSGTPWSELYYKGDYPKLREVKTRWDPLNVFCHAQSIEPWERGT